MLLIFAVPVFLLSSLAFSQNCEFLVYTSHHVVVVSDNFQASHGPLSASTPVPTLSSTVGAQSTTTTSRGLGDYILAALGVTSTISTLSSSYLGLSSSDLSAATQTSSSSTSDAPAPICVYNKCYTDVSFTSIPIEPTGTGSVYASSCSSLLQSFSSASSAWGLVHSSVVWTTQVYGATSYKSITYYENATTLCDGHPRVTYSPAIPLSSTVQTITGLPATTDVFNMSVGWIFPASTPSCSIVPTDCDNLYQAYSSSLSAYKGNATKASDSALYSMITQAPQVPPCVNSTEDAEYSSEQSQFHACGPCTIFGINVELIYFPTTASRDMCASTPIDHMTWYGPDVGSMYDGKGLPVTELSGSPLVTAVHKGNTYTSGTAYISIGDAWTGDRCTASAGTPVSGAIIALPSESLLSLRYSQDHFEYFYSVNTQTGYPFNYADLNTPVPYSAWAGQAQCEPGYGYLCDVIYENNYNPQLAMPPGIRKIRPEWEHCQMWYGGLFDPPYALTRATAVAVATAPGQDTSTTTSAAPSPTKTSIVPATALADTNGDSTPYTTIAGMAVEHVSGNLVVGGHTLSAGGPAISVDGTTLSAAPNGDLVENGATMPLATIVAVHTSEIVFTIGSSLATAHRQADVTGNAGGDSASAADLAVIGSITLTEGAAAHTLADGKIVSLGSKGLVIGAAAQTVTFSSSTGSASDLAAQAVLTLTASDGATTLATVSKLSGTAGTSNKAIVDASITLSQGGPAQTLAGGAILSLGSGGGGGDGGVVIIIIEPTVTATTLSFSDADASGTRTTKGSSSTKSPASITSASSADTFPSPSTSITMATTTTGGAASMTASLGAMYGISFAWACLLFLVG